MDVAADHWVVRIAQQRALLGPPPASRYRGSRGSARRRRQSSPSARHRPSSRYSPGKRRPGRCSSSPHQHLDAIHVPRLHAISGWKYRRVIRVLRRVREVIGTIRVLHGHRMVALEVVSAQVELRAGGEEDIAILQDDAEGDLLRLGKLGAVGPGVAAILGKVDPPILEAKRLLSRCVSM